MTPQDASQIHRVSPERPHGVGAFLCPAPALGESEAPITEPSLRRYSLTLLFRCACISFFSSSGVSFGRSIASVILLILPVNLNGTR